MSWTRTDGRGQEQSLTRSNKLQAPASFRRDGKGLELAFVEVSGGKSKIYVMPVEDDGTQLRAAGEAKPFRNNTTNDFSPRFSPDGQWLAYGSEETEKREVWVQAYPSGRSYSISNGEGGQNPVWSRKSNELFYQSGDRIMVVKYKVNGNKFDPENPVVWAKNLGGVQVGNWDVAPDGKRLLVVTPVAAGEAPKPDHEVTFLLNFFDHLRR
jgi:Tol biopolymer transport system component